MRPVPLATLFTAFLIVSLCGFGGGIVWARRITVEQQQWINEEEFADIVSLCQFMPGPNIVGIAVCVGAKLRGVSGAFAAVRRSHSHYPRMSAFVRRAGPNRK